MALGNFTVGRDVSAVVIAPNGTRIDLSGLTEFKWTPEYKKARSDVLNAPPIERDLPSGHRLTFSIDRNGPTNDLLFLSIEAGWWSIGSVDPGTSDAGSIFFYINEVNGSQTIYQFTGCTLKLSSGGDFKTDSPVKQTIEAFAQQRVM